MINMPKIQDRVSFYEQISRNKRNSVFLIIIIFIVFILLAYVIGLIYHDYFFFILIIGTIISIFYVLIGYYNSDKIAIASVNAKPASRQQYSQYYNIVEGLTIASGLPMPKLYIMENNQINAFATGRDPKHAVVCVTTGALQKLSRAELEGVLSHELSHVANYDIRFMTLVAVLVGMIAIISQIFLRSLWIRGSDREDNKSGAILMLIGVLLAILAPIAVKLVELAISRRREYAADASSVKFTRSPTGLIGALKKIKTDSINENDMKKISKATAPLFISDPFRRKFENLLSTHPPIDERIRILQSM
jgi:heat shock protein HtpX